VRILRQKRSVRPYGCCPLAGRMRPRSKVEKFSLLHGPSLGRVMRRNASKPSPTNCCVGFFKQVPASSEKEFVFAWLRNIDGMQIRALIVQKKCHYAGGGQPPKRASRFARGGKRSGGFAGEAGHPHKLTSEAARQNPTLLRHVGSVRKDHSGIRTVIALI